MESMPVGAVRTTPKPPLIADGLIFDTACLKADDHTLAGISASLVET